jgi:hypothetical protein
VSRLAALIVDESKWLPASMGLAVLVLAILLYRQRQADLPGRRRTLAAMNLFFGVTIATMAFGHLLAVTTKLALGTLEGSPLLLYAIGIALAVPSGWLVHHALGLFASTDERAKSTQALNGWLALTLLGLGVHNIPLALPGLLNIGYQRHNGRISGWAIVGLAVAANVALFVGSLLFLASGQSFEQFSGME